MEVNIFYLLILNFSKIGLCGLRKSQRESAPHGRELVSDFTRKPRGETERRQRNYYLDCKSAQKIPLFLPIVCSSEFIVRQFPWAVQRTKNQTESSLEVTPGTAPPPRGSSVCYRTLTGSRNSDEDRCCVEGPWERLDKNGNVHAKIQQVSALQSNSP